MPRKVWCAGWCRAHVLVLPSAVLDDIPGLALLMGCCLPGPKPFLVLAGLRGVEVDSCSCGPCLIGRSDQ
eukprot:13112796-Heterocapsa_arctica.AAC.1